jgi:LPS sulfotransferase NodH
MGATGRLVAVLSMENSGSSLVTAILGGSPVVIAPPELHLFRYPEFDRWLEEKPDAMASLTWLLRALEQPASTQDALDRFSGCSTSDITRELLELCGPDRILVDKTPAYARDTAVLRRIEAFHPHYLWIVRHPLGVVSSNIQGRASKHERRLAGARTPAGRLGVALRQARDRVRLASGGFVRQRLAYWREVNERLESWAEELGGERVHRVVYERLVRAPEPEIRSLCAALELEFSPAMLQPGANVPEALTWGIGSEKVNLHASIEASVADRWRETLDEELLDDATLELMRRLAVS